MSSRIQTNSDETYVTDPFTQVTLNTLSERDRKYVNGDDYAIQRYGEREERQIFLTFDDGPDETYTPQLLDILSRESAPSTFFITGSNVAKFPEITKRVVQEGHSLGNHTFSHIDFSLESNFRGEQEINQTARILAAAINIETDFFRPPYGGNTDQSLRNSVEAILTAQKLGYTVVSYDFDSNDWHFPSGIEEKFPEFDGKSKVILLHDGGGERSQTITYVTELIKRAKNSGYTFSNIETILPQAGSGNTTNASLPDIFSFILAQAVLVWPEHVVKWLFTFSVLSLLAVTLINIILAIVYKFKSRSIQYPKNYKPSVTIILPAYNEDKVLEKSVRSLLRSRYRKMEITLVDDGSTDTTWQLAQSLAKKYRRVTAIHQANGGKSSALNNAISLSKSDIILCADADTVIPTTTITNLIRHFHDESVGAVAGVVKVGNTDSMLTKWQALEYATGISIERNAQAAMNAIMIVPGACGAWRRTVLMELGGFSNSTLAEDCDLALKIQQTRRYKVLQDNDAVSFTEAPQSLSSLTKQRFRWTFGNIQSLWKHRSMVFSRGYRWLGLYVMPSVIVGILVPVVFWPFLIGITVMNILSGNYTMIILFFSLSLAIQIAVSMIGIILAKERLSYLLSVPLGRIVYGPIKIYILYKTLLTIIKGVDVGWNKLARTGTVQEPLSPYALLTHSTESKRA